MDWARIGRSCLETERDALRLLREHPKLDRRYFEALEARYTRWLAELHAAGVLAPNLTVLLVTWLAGLAYARLLPGRWQALLALVTLAWLVREFMVAGRDQATA